MKKWSRTAGLRDFNGTFNKDIKPSQQSNLKFYELIQLTAQ